MKDGRVLREIRPNDYEKGGESADAYQYSYDVLGREIALKGPDGTLIYEKSYNAAGYLTAQRDTRGGGMRYDYTYHADGSVKEKKASGRILLSYEYDRNGNRTLYRYICGYEYDTFGTC